MNKVDALKQYAKLKQQLVAEKSELEARLNEINAVLGTETAPSNTPALAAIPTPASRPAPVRRGRRPAADNSITMKEAVLRALAQGPLARKELVKAVQGVGYVFTAKNPLNSLGSVLYAKNTPIKNKGGKFFLSGPSQPALWENSGNGHDSNGSSKRTMSPAAKAKLSASQTARWAKKKSKGN